MVFIGVFLISFALIGTVFMYLGKVSIRSALFKYQEKLNSIYVE